MARTTSADAFLFCTSIWSISLTEKGTDETPVFTLPTSKDFTCLTATIAAVVEFARHFTMPRSDYPGRPHPGKKGIADCGRWNVLEDRILLNPSNCIGLVQPTLSPARLQLDCSENVDEEAVEQWINEDSTLECCEVLSDDDIVSSVTCDSEETRNFEECPESDDENLVAHQKLSHGGALVHTEVLLYYLKQKKEDESTPAEKMILKNLRSIIRQRVNEKQKQTSVISIFTK
ncbi:hypothetical protein AVEN_115749-1 [Araneus ventricosus]|uniref:Uncharacterized protein n=1 Tax=Araneus ventricosus TaxID=182803 RepID=A0A4Y2AX75_ARAVE|nr:hypothetical protein AVEN_70744-1 [Araneus ventricosus]GBL82739.1 hypothetical protein AVEN_215094-1 [Araneus ventricosus]GBL83480.1 hypothetical protein AVEN_62358-1 [Araneus ventricosus]GBL84450.1 hypothetical protein AVEN_115749-1 [Araneus ventricosus]